MRAAGLLVSGVLPAGLLAAGLLAAGLVAGCSATAARPGPAASGPVRSDAATDAATDDTPVGPVAAGITFGTEVDLGQVPAEGAALTRQARFVADRDAAVAALFAARSHAVLTRDRAAFLATVDPGSAVFAASQSSLFAGLMQLPLGAYALHQQDVAAYPPPEPSSRDAGLDVFVPQVRVSYRLAGWDSGEVGRLYAWTLLRRGGRWRLASTSDEAGHGVPAAADPWDLGPVTVHRAGTVLLVASGLTPGQVAAVSALATQAVADDRHYLPGWSGRAVLYASRSTALFDHLFAGAAHTAASYSGAEVPQEADDGDPTLTGTRILVNPAAVSFSDTSRTSAEAVVLRHELTHVALAPMRGPARPLWLTEGVAEYVSYAPFPGAAPYEQDVRRRALGTAQPPGIPADSRFTTGGDGVLDTAYADAWLVCQNIVDREGLPALLRLYAAESVLPAGDHGDAAATDAVLRRVLGLGAARLQARYLAGLRAA